jgi:hypothetical protein
MQMSKQAQDVLSIIFDSFRTGYVEANPGCNENDVERAFLSQCPKLAYGYAEDAIDDMIERIR